MKSYLIIITSLLGVFIYSCSTKTEKEGKINDREYAEFMRLYPENLINHFPKAAKLKEDYKSYISYSSKYSTSQLFIIQVESKEILDSLKLLAREMVSTDTSFLIVNKHLRESNTVSLAQQYANYQVQSYISSATPIPNFYDIEEFSELTYHKLNKDFILYEFDNKPGRVWDKKHHEGIWHMPEQWEDGFSKGFAINEKKSTVIYWVVVW